MLERTSSPQVRWIYDTDVTQDTLMLTMTCIAVNGTTGILHAIKKSAPSVKRVVITSSFAAIIDPAKPSNYVYSEVNENSRTLTAHNFTCQS